MSDVAVARMFSAVSFNEYLKEHKLMASRCVQCGSLHVPPRAICPQCHGSAMEWVPVSGRGRLVAFTVIYSGPDFMVAQGFDRAHPYISGIVQLDEGMSISARITGLNPGRPEDICIGTVLAVDFLESGEGEASKTSLAFRAVEQDSAL